MYILQAALQKKQKLQDSLNFGTGAAPQREGRQATTEAAIATEEATEDQQQEELKAAAANNNGGLDDGCCENEAADCELLPSHKPAAAGSSQESDFGSLLGKRRHSAQVEDSLSEGKLEKEWPLNTKNGKFVSTEKTKVASPGVSTNNKQ